MAYLGTHKRILIGAGAAALLLVALIFLSSARTYSHQAEYVNKEAGGREQGIGDMNQEVKAGDQGATNGGQNAEGKDVANSDKGSPVDPLATHVQTPEAVRAIYMTSCVASVPRLRGRLVQLVEDTKLNSIVIDIKDYSGTLSYRPRNRELMHAWQTARCPVDDMRELIESLHQKQIYVIGRITVFQDPYLAELHPEWALKSASTGELWQDDEGLYYTDPGARAVWEYHAEIAWDAYRAGFDELNFDYIRFPSDGQISDIRRPKSAGTPKPVVLEKFFRYLDKQLRRTPELANRPNGGPVISADLFGMTTTTQGDLGIGQVWERALPYFDYLAPMVYPSHYAPHFNGWANPNKHPYGVVHYAMTTAVERTTATSTSLKTFGAEQVYETVLVPSTGTSTATTTRQVFTGLYTKPSYDPDKIRPWLQDFDYGGDYTAADVRAQIQAVYDAGLDSWMLWDAQNTYTKAALEKN